MNYLWEILLQAKEENREIEALHFEMAKRYSPYKELASPILNQTLLSKENSIEMNPYYRFYSIFKEMFLAEGEEYKELRRGLFNLLFHLLGYADIRMGLTLEEYHKKLLWKDLGMGLYGKELKESSKEFSKKEKQILLSGILRQYRVGNSLSLFCEMVGGLIPGSIVYCGNQNPYEILIYIGEEKTRKLERKLNFLISMFVGIQYSVERYYQFHFGVIGIHETMLVDEITMC